MAKPLSVTHIIGVYATGNHRQIIPISGSQQNLRTGWATWFRVLSAPDNQGYSLDDTIPVDPCGVAVIL